ncbi:MAG: glycosyl transferase [Pedobacter sp.]|nr:MAG: glycosyl transferase [Pedobacter sp.]
MKDQLSPQKLNWLYLLLGMAVLVNLSGLFVTIIGPDGTLYASISKTMVLKNNYVELFVEGRDWLDKPHFPFWMAAFSFKLFGVSTFAYKIPAILFLFIGAYYTYKLAADIHGKEIGLWAALILLTAQHVVISNNDVRAEPYLTGLIIGSVYHFFKAQQKGWLIHLLLGSLFAACAVMTKGIFALVPVVGAIAGSLLITKNWHMLFNLRWLLAFIFVSVLILPELWCLYAQFDMHPEKLVFDQQNVSGLRFFFWDSQFGRFFNTGPIKKSGGDPAFFLHTSIWAFLPWSFIFYCAVVQFISKKALRIQKSDWICISGAALTLIVLSASSFQLPHYIIMIFPFFAIIAAKYISSLTSPRTIRNVKTLQYVVMSLMVTAIVVIQVLFQPDLSIVLLIVIAGLIALSIYFYRKHFAIYLSTVLVALVVNFFFNLAFYPKLVTYQADSEAAFWLNKHNDRGFPVVKVVNNFNHALNFYSNFEVHNYRPGEEDLLPPRPYLLYAETEAINQMINDGMQIQPVKTFDNYRISRLKLKFLNVKTRKETLSTTEIVLVR